MSSNTPTYSSARPRRRRSYPYRLPLGAFCCILIWFFAIFIDDDSESTEGTDSVAFAQLPIKVASEKPYQVYNFEEDDRPLHEVHQEVNEALLTYGSSVRNSKRELPEAQIFLPENYPYQSFQELVKTSQAEGLRLMLGEDHQLIIRK